MVKSGSMNGKIRVDSPMLYYSFTGFRDCDISGRFGTLFGLGKTDVVGEVVHDTSGIKTPLYGHLMAPHIKNGGLVLLCEHMHFSPFGVLDETHKDFYECFRVEESGVTGNYVGNVTVVDSNRIGEMKDFKTYIEVAFPFLKHNRNSAQPVLKVQE